MDYSKITFKSYMPNYKHYLDELKNDKSITKYVSFSESDSTLIFYDNIFCGFCKIIDFDDNDNKEIHIALINEFRGLGLASYIIQTFSNNIFNSYHDCQFAVLSIDCENDSSLKMANKCGFTFNEELTKENIKYGDTKTLIFTKNNPYYKSLNK